MAHIFAGNGSGHVSQGELPWPRHARLASKLVDACSTSDAALHAENLDTMAHVPGLPSSFPTPQTDDTHQIFSYERCFYAMVASLLSSHHPGTVPSTAMVATGLQELRDCAAVRKVSNAVARASGPLPADGWGRVQSRLLLAQVGPFRRTSQHSGFGCSAIDTHGTERHRTRRAFECRAEHVDSGARFSKGSMEEISRRLSSYQTLLCTRAADLVENFSFLAEEVRVGPGEVNADAALAREYASFSRQLREDIRRQQDLGKFILSDMGFEDLRTLIAYYRVRAQMQRCLGTPPERKRDQRTPAPLAPDARLDPPSRASRDAPHDAEARAGPHTSRSPPDWEPIILAALQEECHQFLTAGDAVRHARALSLAGQGAPSESGCEEMSVMVHFAWETRQSPLLVLALHALADTWGIVPDARMRRSRQAACWRLALLSPHAITSQWSGLMMGGDQGGGDSDGSRVGNYGVDLRAGDGKYHAKGVCNDGGDGFGHYDADRSQEGGKAGDSSEYRRTGGEQRGSNHHGHLWLLCRHLAALGVATDVTDARATLAEATLVACARELQEELCGGCRSQGIRGKDNSQATRLDAGDTTLGSSVGAESGSSPDMTSRSDADKSHGAAPQVPHDGACGADLYGAGLSCGECRHHAETGLLPGPALDARHADLHVCGSRAMEWVPPHPLPAVRMKAAGKYAATMDWLLASLGGEPGGEGSRGQDGAEEGLDVKGEGDGLLGSASDLRLLTCALAVYTLSGQYHLGLQAIERLHERLAHQGGGGADRDTPSDRQRCLGESTSDDDDPRRVDQGGEGRPAIGGSASRDAPDDSIGHTTVATGGSSTKYGGKWSTSREGAEPTPLPSAADEAAEAGRDAPIPSGERGDAGPQGAAAAGCGGAHRHHSHATQSSSTHHSRAGTSGSASNTSNDTRAAEDATCGARQSGGARVADARDAAASQLREMGIITGRFVSHLVQGGRVEDAVGVVNVLMGIKRRATGVTDVSRASWPVRGCMEDAIGGLDPEGHVPRVPLSWVPVLLSGRIACELLRCMRARRMFRTAVFMFEEMRAENRERGVLEDMLRVIWDVQ
eukprot:jgi/Mesvir1/26790/Mv20558-RA.1